jgi:hypothetical protein
MTPPPPHPALAAAIAALIASTVAGCAAQPPLLTTSGLSSPAAPTAAAPVQPGAGASGTVRPITGAPDAPAPTPGASTPGASTPGASTRPSPTAGLPGTATLTSPDPGVVAVAALTVAYSADTVTDTSPLAAQRRALPWFGGGYAAALRAANDAAAGPGAAWNNWSAHRAQLVVHVAAAADDHPADTPTTADRQYLLTQTPTAPGWTGPAVSGAVYVGLTRTPGGRWQVTELDQESP